MATILSELTFENFEYSKENLILLKKKAIVKYRKAKTASKETEEVEVNHQKIKKIVKKHIYKYK